MKDARGLAVVCDAPEALQAIDDFATRMLRLARGSEAVLAAADRFPETPLLQLYAAAAGLFAQTGAADAEAARWLERAAALAARAHAREEAWRRALVHWQAHEFGDAATAFETLTARWPEDLVAAKACEFLYYVLGQQHEGARFLRHMERLEAHHYGDADFLAMLAFARELTGDLDGARHTAERALAVRHDNPWADHALAHVWIRRGETEAAIAHLSAALPAWERSLPVIRAHDAWHLALHHLERLDFAAALDLLEREIGDDDQVGIAIDAISLLWRCEMAGHDAGARWAAIADRVERHLEPCFMPFLSAHYAYALGRAGREAALERLLAVVRERAEAADADAHRTWARAGKALVEAAAAFGEGDARRSATLLEPIERELTVGGGSDAQCDLFRLTLFRALAASGRKPAARAVLERTLGAKAATPLDERWRALAA